MSPNRNPYSNNPLLAIIKGGKQAVTPPQFGLTVPQATLPSPALPRTVQSTPGMRFTPPPVQASQPVATPPPINPLDIIKRGKEQVVRQGVQANTFKDPTGLLAGTGRREAPSLNFDQKSLFGKVREVVTRTVRERGLVPAAGDFLFEGFTKTAAPTPEQYADRLNERTQVLVSAGFSPDLAERYAVQDVFDNTLIKGGRTMSGQQAVPQASLGLELPPNAKGALRGINLFEDAFAALDAPIFLGTTKPISMGVKGLIKPFKYTEEMRKAVNEYADVVNGVSKLDAQAQLEAKATAQALADAFAKKGFIDSSVQVSGDKALANALRKHMDKSDEILPSAKQPSSDATPPTTLLEEAKKHPTPEAFEDSLKSKILVHGGRGELEGGKLALGKSHGGQDAGGIFFAENTPDGINYARGYTLKGDDFNGKIHKAVLKPNVKIFDFTNPADREVLRKAISKEEFDLYLESGNGKHFDWAQAPDPDLIEKLGYQGMKVRERQAGFNVYDESFKQVPSKDDIVAVQVFSPDSFEMLPDKVNLTDIWKQANKPTNPKLEAFKAGKGNAQSGFADFFSPARQPKKLSQIDQLIADNKVRVVSRDGRDVYQVKQGKDWRNVRDEDSAIRQATRAREMVPKSPRRLPDYLEEKLMSVDFAKEALDANPAKELSRFVSKRGDSRGRLAEVTGKQGSKTGIGVDVRVADLGFDSTEQARDAYDAYRVRKEEVLAMEKAVKAEVKAFQATEKLRAKTVVPERAVDQVRELQKVSPEQVRSLEEASQKLNEVLDLPPGQRPQPLKVIIPQTPVQQKVHLLDYVRTPDRVMRKIGFGEEQRFLRNQYEKYVVELPKNIDRVSEWVKRVPKDSNERIFDYLDGQAVTLTKAEQEVADEIRAYLKEWADRLKLPEDSRVTNYITRLFEDSLIQKEFDEDLAKIITDKLPGEVYNPFLQKRLGAKGYRRDTWAALDAYTKRATRKVHLDPALERIRDRAGAQLEFSRLEKSQFNYIQNYINRVQMRPTYIDELIDNGVKNVVGYRFGQRPVVAISRFLRQMTYRGMLGANLGSAVRNLSQGINTYATLGEKYTVIGYAKMFNTGSWKELVDNGVLAQDFIEDRVLSSTKKALQRADKAIWFFFDTAEKINRGSAYFGAKAKAINMGMGEGEAIEYAKSIVRKTQFNYDAVDTPVVLATDLVKTLAQFQTFTVKQIEFLTEMAKDKNFVGLLRYGIAGYAFVNTIGQAMGMEEKELLPWFRFDVPPSLKFPYEAARSGMVAAGVGLEDKYGNELNLEKQLENTGKSLLGLIPGGIQAKKTVEGAQLVEDGASFDSAGRVQFEQTDTPAGKVQSILFGKYASPQAKEYFNKTGETGDKELDRAKKEEAKEAKRVREESQKLYKELKQLPPAEANAKAREIKQTDPAVHEALKKIAKEEKKKADWTTFDKGVASLGVENGKRAEFIYNRAKKLPPEEANALIRDLREKGIVTKEVQEQIKALKEEERDIINQ